MRGGPAAPAAPGGGAAAGFPVTIAHKYGDTTITAPPTRVVSLGYTDQDAILALSVVPVAIREFTGDQPSATWPWARDRLRVSTRRCYPSPASVPTPWPGYGPT